MHLNGADVRLPYFRDVLGYVDLSITLGLYALDLMRSVGPPAPPSPGPTGQRVDRR